MGETKRKIKTAAIGVGSLGRHHARVLKALASEGNTEFVGVCDASEETARAVSAEHQSDFYTDWRELLGKTEAVSIATPTETHAEIAVEFLRRGVHCLVEKPIARTLEEANRIIAAARESGAKLMVGQLERFNPAIVALRPHVTTPLYFEIHRISPFPARSLDVDVVLDVMIHDLDMVSWFVNAEIAEIRAVGIPILTDKVDAANVRLEFQNGTVANITASRVGAEKIRKMRFYQPHAYVAVDYVTKYAALTSLAPGAENPLFGIRINRLNVSDIEPLRAEIEAFVDSILEDKAPPVTGEDGRRALSLALGVLERIDEHRERLTF
ncbi:MAG: Gfo/Idh/MocA family oxidoreductase [Acidobacteriota bacterium]|nr:Gfo/Idh/MocA family oxidoreductase [Acidobacteriota bacterium]